MVNNLVSNLMSNMPMVLARLQPDTLLFLRYLPLPDKVLKLNFNNIQFMPFCISACELAALVTAELQYNVTGSY
jgi:hypothetical protein